MPQKTTFQVALWNETHYLIEVEASSYEDAENRARMEVEAGSAAYDHTAIYISGSEAMDPYWDEESEEEETESMEVTNGI